MLLDPTMSTITEKNQCKKSKKGTKTDYNICSAYAMKTKLSSSNN